ncbi:uncharacterized protein N7498_004668 [Penicillium cinerascens]|uniref:HTH CENPB-type domain-containing protein n=1 Tax=Penicillium cinerascens TaxID=70096 RepID=A0A9W9MLZ6_9EURO|nr:uncharacterized protein N7498_004668 [Penicillium cinerascens]KAJ5203789.1 hypothetical protein N7498_004668 [Penicillium cinerascens]
MDPMDESPPAPANVSRTPNHPRSRGGISDVQKKALRDWVRSHETRPKHTACIDWFERTYQRHINQSSVSLILSKRYDHLDAGPVSSAMRKQTPQWPVLEKELSEWLQRMQDAGRTVSGDWIIAKAREIWPRINQDDQPVPMFSQGWLTRFKNRFASRVPDGTEVEHLAAPSKSRKELNGLRAFCGEFMQEDIYSMDETGLLWRKAPFDAIQNEDQSSLDKERSRVCLIVCTNCTGGDRLPLWVVGHKETPEPLRFLNLRAIDCQWRYNQKAWISTTIMSEWLLSFYEHVGERRVLLLLDDSQAHQAAVESTPPPANVHIQIFSAQAGGVKPPLNQGITRNLKQHYRKRYLSYMVAGFQAGQSPVHTMSLYYTLSWITQIWRWDVTNATIFKGFRRSNLIEPQLSILASPKVPGMRDLYNAVIQYNQSGQPPTSLEQFLDPLGEDGDEQLNEASWPSPDSQTAELDEAFTIIPASEFLPSPQTVITGIERIMRYMDHHKIGTADQIQLLEELEIMAERDIMNSLGS